MPQSRPNQKQSETLFDHAQDHRTVAGTLLQQASDISSVGVARDTGFQATRSVRLKREAEDALPEAETGGGAKRIKQEDLKQED